MGHSFEPQLRLVTGLQVLQVFVVLQLRLRPRNPGMCDVGYDMLVVFGTEIGAFRVSLLTCVCGV